MQISLTSLFANRCAAVISGSAAERKICAIGFGPYCRSRGDVPNIHGRPAERLASSRKADRARGSKLWNVSTRSTGPLLLLNQAAMPVAGRFFQLSSNVFGCREKADRVSGGRQCRDERAQVVDGHGERKFGKILGPVTIAQAASGQCARSRPTSMAESRGSVPFVWANARKPPYDLCRLGPHVTGRKSGIGSNADPSGPWLGKPSQSSRIVA